MADNDTDPSKPKVVVVVFEGGHTLVQAASASSGDVVVFDHYLRGVVTNKID